LLLKMLKYWNLHITAQRLYCITNHYNMLGLCLEAAFSTNLVLALNNVVLLCLSVFFLKEVRTSFLETAKMQYSRNYSL
jgi:hypothetical protein